ncbi:MAG: ornithine cyclodeaminase [Lachnospiraceae bacterium]|jgi:ornithine cyclodeaminase|nr:ornithine cyclodeaminase [Lachnospiraceae bacterium]
MGKHTDFIYLSEPDAIAAGVGDAAACVDTIEESFRLLSEGDYLMGGPNHNNHGITMVFPKSSPFPNMPLDGPDRRFAAMPAYLGGRFDVCGCKWYGSNAENTKNGLPRSVLMMFLNDKSTGEPLCLMSANLISAARTGAVPGVATRHLANPDAQVCAVIGCGPINKACTEAIRTQMKSAKRFVCYDLFEDKAQAFADWIKKDLGVDASSSTDLADTVAQGDVVSIAASRLKPLHLEEAWLKKGSTILLTGPAKGEDGVFLNSNIILDHVKLQEAYVEDAIASGDKEAFYAGVIGGPIFSLIDKGLLPPLSDFTAIGDVIRGKRPGRKSPDERVLFLSCGMAVYDVAWTYDIYQNALKKGIGTKLLLWDSPAQA